MTGLRREEVAQLAGVSVDYVVRLEQGRGPHPSRSVRRNIIWQRFLGTSSRVAMTEEEREASAGQSVASLRVAAARYPDDPGLARLLADLRHGSDFVRFRNDGGATPWRSHRKTIAHPSLGLLTLDCETLLVPDDEQSVIAYSAAGMSP